MLVSFTMENWKSYREEATLSLLADRSRRHANTLAVCPYYHGLKILPIAAIYGGNAAGKSNLFDALRFVQRFVAFGQDDDTAISVEPFAWGDASEKPSRFSIQMLVSQKTSGAFQPTRSSQPEIIYQLDFALDRNSVVEEALSWYDSQRNVHLLYERDDQGQVTFSPEFARKLGEEEAQTLRIVARGAGPRRLFLTNTVDQQVSTFRHIYDWFRKGLRTADNGIQSPRVAALMSDQAYCEQLGTILHALGTGVERIELQLMPEGQLDLGLRNHMLQMMEAVADNSMAQLLVNTGLDVANQIFVLTKENNLVTIRRVQTYRDGRPFGFERESSGTRRLIEILPIFLDLWTGVPCTWVLDEMEREFHTEMTRELLMGFLAKCGEESRTQTLLNTHDLMLMDQEVFRKDEILVAERTEEGVSSLCSIGDYEGIRNDLDLRRSYLDGRFGGRPTINEGEFAEAIHGEK